MHEFPEFNSILVLPRMQIQNANCISSSFTWGFPSITAFIGFMWALQRRFHNDKIHFKGIGVVCHDFSPQVHKGIFEHRFHLTRNPLDHKGLTSPIVEEGRAHMNISLLLACKNGIDSEGKEGKDFIQTLTENLASLRVAGGTILSSQFESQKPRFIALDEDGRFEQFRCERRRFLPGFALVARDDLLATHFDALRNVAPETSLLDAWLDLSRLNTWAQRTEKVNTTTGETQETIEWKWTQRDGWIVPIPVGYAALSELYPAGTVHNARDTTTPFQFVESIYSLGEWIGPHRCDDINELLWFANTDEEHGIYRCSNAYGTLHKSEKEI